MKAKPVIGVAGSGSMGSGIAQVAAAAGHHVLVFDTDVRALDKARSFHVKNMERLIEKNKLTREDATNIIASVSYVNNLEAMAESSLIIEAIVENLEVKKKLFHDLERHVSASCILATNTSSLPVVAVASGCRERARVIGIHFFNPATLMPLVEIIPAFTTGEQTVSASRSLIESWDKVTVLAKDTPGFIVNRIARPYYGEAIKMYEEGIATIDTIDWAMKEYGGFRMGPFELMDFIGNDINYHRDVALGNRHSF